MTRELLTLFFLWCTIINYTILLLWFATFILLRRQIRQLHGRWFSLSDEGFNALHYGGIGIYKLGILLFNLTPYIALQIVR